MNGAHGFVIRRVNIVRIIQVAHRKIDEYNLNGAIGFDVDEIPRLDILVINTNILQFSDALVNRVQLC